MNLRWSAGLNRFEAEFQDFASEQPRVQEAGFRTDGPPHWVWYSQKAAPLTKLRENKPAILTITSEARAAYIRLKEVEDKNAAVKSELAKHQKELKKKLNADKQDKMQPDEYLDTVLGFICLKVLPKSFPPPKFVIPSPPAELCFICKTPIYFYEKQSPPTCLWCEIKVLDNSVEVC